MPSFRSAVLPALALAALLIAGCAAPARSRPTATWRGLDRHAQDDGQAPSMPAGDMRYFSIGAGVRQFSDDWEPVDQQTVYAVEVDSFDTLTGHGWELGAAYSDDSDGAGSTLGIPNVGDAEGRTTEIYGGYRLTLNPDEPGWHPYLGVGLSVLRAEAELQLPSGNVDDDDWTGGAYARAGLFYEFVDLGHPVRVALDYRHLFLTDIDLFGVSTDADFDQLLLSIGWGF